GAFQQHAGLQILDVVDAVGAFVDIGVHQDGLVHVSQLADRFIKDAHEVVKAGDVVKVRVVDVDIKRKRIALSMRKDGGEGGASKGGGPRDNGGDRPVPRSSAPQRQPERPAQQGAFGAALADALKRK
ncbi:S1 RNA-binding domain-containing protein, partial [Mesorhizobium sp. M7D.F.Ca.US.004.03.1.1]|uniref:S1 RNA-binding domain-containing protein n=1 Tax=Mesorhizobium sp. M7D.F.Ca.US.004.03.1.1 TaxID=2496702 RepID=UPI000FCCD2F7